MSSCTTKQNIRRKPIIQSNTIGNGPTQPSPSKYVLPNNKPYYYTLLFDKINFNNNTLV
jgi:hypothetical protein